MANLERIYTIPFGKIYECIRNKRGKRAVKFVREFALRHMKGEAVRISEGVNSLILRDGIQKPPRRIKVRMIKGEDNLVRVWLMGEEEKVKAAAEKKKKETEAKKPEAKPTAPAAKTTAPAASAKPAPSVQAAKPTTQTPAAATMPAPATAKPAAPAKK